MAEISRLVPNPHQPRREFLPEELGALAESIRTSGVLQPILVRRVGDHLQIIAGERRWRAAKHAGLERIPALVRDVSDEQAAVFGLVENLHREDLNAIEKAQAFKRIQELTGSSQDEVARQVGLERSTVANFVRLLELPGEVQAHVSRGTLNMGQARALLGLADPSEQTAVAEQAIRKRLSVRQVEALVQTLKTQQSSTTRPGQKDDGRSADGSGRPMWLKEIEDNLREALHAPVSVRYGKKRSKITIECQGREEFERVYELLKGRADH